MPWAIALWLADGLRALRGPRAGAALLLQWLLGLRPGELLRIRGGHITPGERNAVSPGVGLVALGR
eukprot:6338123-Alexandrium_andersonii.AAC.1